MIWRSLFSVLFLFLIGSLIGCGSAAQDEDLVIFREFKAAAVLEGEPLPVQYEDVEAMRADDEKTLRSLRSALEEAENEDGEAERDLAAAGYFLVHLRQNNRWLQSRVKAAPPEFMIRLERVEAELFRLLQLHSGAGEQEGKERELYSRLDKLEEMMKARYAGFRFMEEASVTSER